LLATIAQAPIWPASPGPDCAAGRPRPPLLLDPRGAARACARALLRAGGDERFGEAPAEAETATERLAQAIEWCLPLPGSQERDWVLWVELWLRAVRDPELRPVAARLYQRYRAWIADVIRSGVDSGEFRGDVNVAAAADIATAMLDGAGVRMLIRDPAMQLERTRALVAETLARELGVGPGVLASSRDQ
jgi:BetI-type transcriptional repressor, C-terminal